ncbi:InlB B-repeat-containing protein, partial [Olsenella uli]|uniref:InlB B-repeat-containing protein n=1 Tax=Olsenella uli TaxID=133926 RepID=UPI00195E11A5
SGAIASTAWTEDTYFVAQFVAEPEAATHKVTFVDGLDGTTDAVVEVKDGESVARPDEPTYDGWTFVDWFTDSEFTTKYDFSTPVTEDITLYGGWVKNGSDDSGVTDGTETPTTPAGGAATSGTNADEPAMPQTSDPTVAVSGIAGLGAAIAGLGAFLKRRH